MTTDNQRPEYDELIHKIATYALEHEEFSESSWDTARLCLLDSIACAYQASVKPGCVKLLGPWVPNSTVKNGARVLARSDQLDPIKAALDNGVLIRWLDFNDTWLAAEWGHPSDNLGAILALADYMSRNPQFAGGKIGMQQVLLAAMKAHEIQGVLALENSFNQVGLDHVVLVKVASCAASCYLLGLSQEQTCAAISHAWADGQSLRTYRHAPNTGSRKSWAAGDASARGLRLALLARTDEMGIPSVLSAKTWGFSDVSFKGAKLSLAREFGDYVMNNVLFKVLYPAEFHAQTAVECAIALHEKLGQGEYSIKKVKIETQAAGMRIINKTGPLYNYADRDHCIQYMVAIGLLKGDLTAEDYEDEVASNPAIDKLREKMTVSEDERFSIEYLDPEKRAIGNRVTVITEDGQKLVEQIDYPIGHRKRRLESIAWLRKKFNYSLEQVTQGEQLEHQLRLFDEREQIDSFDTHAFIDMFSLPN